SRGNENPLVAMNSATGHLTGPTSQRSVVLSGHQRNGRYGVTLIQGHDANPRRVSPLGRHLAHRRADEHATGRDEEHFVVQADHEGFNDETARGGELDSPYALPTATLTIEALGLHALAKARVG